MKKDDNQYLSTNPILPVKEVSETARFYEEYLGFSVDVLWKNPNYACVSRGSVTIEFGEARPEHVGSGVCYIHVNNVKQVHDELKNRKVKMVGQLEDRKYGSKDFRIRDNNGNLIIFGSPLANQDALLVNPCSA